MPKWETDARESVRAAIRKCAKPLQDLVARDANEGDTRLLVTDFFCDALGYDKHEELEHTAICEAAVQARSRESASQPSRTTTDLARSARGGCR